MLPQDMPVAQASCRLPPQGAQTVGITGLTVKPDKHEGPLGHTTMAKGASYCRS